MQSWFKILMRLAIWLRKYLVALVLLTFFVWSMWGVYWHGTGPVPQQPPRGFEVVREQASLHWSKGTRAIPVSLQVSVDDPLFNDPEVDKVVTSTSHKMRNLKAGSTYYWRLVQGDTSSPVAHFRVSPNNVGY